MFHRHIGRPRAVRFGVRSIHHIGGAGSGGLRAVHFGIKAIPFGPPNPCSPAHEARCASHPPLCKSRVRISAVWKSRVRLLAVQSGFSPPDGRNANPRSRKRPQTDKRRTQDPGSIPRRAGPEPGIPPAPPDGPESNPESRRQPQTDGARTLDHDGGPQWTRDEPGALPTAMG